MRPVARNRNVGMDFRGHQALLAIAETHQHDLAGAQFRQAEAALAASEAAFRFGERGIIEVLDAQRVLRSVRFDYLNAQYDRQAALVELERLRAIRSRTP